MATQIHYFQGTAKWAKVHEPDVKYDNFSVNLYLDEPSRKRYDASGLTLKEREDEDGQYVKFSRKNTGNFKGDADHVFGPPSVLNPEGETITDNIGNGSQVTCKVEVYDGARGKGHRLEAVRVDSLVPYDGTTIVMGEDEVPF